MRQQRAFSPHRYRVRSDGQARCFFMVSSRISTIYACSRITTRQLLFRNGQRLKDNYDVLPLSMLSEVLREPRRYKRATFLMSDDGYANTLTNAADILASFDLPWTLFVSTQHIDTRERSPVFIARLFFLFAPEGQYAIPGLGLITLGGQREEAADRYGGTLKTLGAAEAEEAVEAMRAALPDLEMLLERFESDAFLTWDQVRELKRRGVEIGAHAHRHWAMHPNQTQDYVREQALLSRARIEAEVAPCRYFAYPFGNVTDVGREAWHAVRDAGYEYAFTTLSGTLDASRNPWLMPRYGLRVEEPRLASLIPSLRFGNGRLVAGKELLAINPLESRYGNRCHSSVWLMRS